MKVLNIWIGALLLSAVLSGSALADFKDGLVGYWNFDETSGDVAHSLVPDSGDGQLYNFPDDNSQWVPGQIGGALYFRGPDSQDYVIVPSYPIFTSSFSFSGWVNADRNDIQWQSIFKNWGGATGQFHFGLSANRNNKLAVSIALDNGWSNGDVPIVTRVFPTGAWVHVGFVVDTTLHGVLASVKVYFNGQLQGEAAFDGTLNNPRMTTIGIGVKTDDSGLSPGGPPGYWQGSFDDFGLWSRALSDDEMAQIYALGLLGQSFYTP